MMSTAPTCSSRQARKHISYVRTSFVVVVVLPANRFVHNLCVLRAWQCYYSRDCAAQTNECVFGFVVMCIPRPLSLRIAVDFMSECVEIQSKLTCKLTHPSPGSHFNPCKFTLGQIKVNFGIYHVSQSDGAGTALGEARD